MPSLPAEQPRVPPWQALRSGPAWLLLRFLFGLVAISALSSLYLWQASTITDIQLATRRLDEQAYALEQQNVALMLEVAAWNRPDYVEDRALAAGMVPAPQTAVVQAPATGALHASQAEQTDILAEWWQELVFEVGRRVQLARARLSLPGDPAVP